MAMMYYGSATASNSSYAYRSRHVQDTVTHPDQGMIDFEVIEHCKHICNDYELPNKINQKELIINVIKHFRDDRQRSLRTAFMLTLRKYNKELQTH